MKIKLLASWSFVPKKQPGWLCTTMGGVGVHLADGTFELRRAVKDAPVVATLSLPKKATVALDPCGEVIACVDGAAVTLLDLKGKALARAALEDAFALDHVAFRRAGAQLWIFGTLESELVVNVFDRKLKKVGEHRIDFSGSTMPSVEVLHPTKDDFVLTRPTGGDDPEEATTGRIGVVNEGGKLRVAFSVDVVEHPCIGFLANGRSLIGVDFFGITLYDWPSYKPSREAAHADGFEGGLNGIIVGPHLLTERHEDAIEDTPSSLLVLSLPQLQDEAEIPWTKRGPFAHPTDVAGLDLHCALSADTFLELSQAKKKQWSCRIWQLQG